MLGNIGPLEIAIVLIVALLVFGPKRLPELGRGVGEGLKGFKDSVTGDGDDAKRSVGPESVARDATDEAEPGSSA